MTTIARKPPTFEEEIMPKQLYTEREIRMMEKRKVEFDDPTFRPFGHLEQLTPDEAQAVVTVFEGANQRIASLEAKLEIAVKMLEYYADETNWNEFPKSVAMTVIVGSGGLGFLPARKALAEIAEVK